jgi:hypothetical protein
VCSRGHCGARDLNAARGNEPRSSAPIEVSRDILYSGASQLVAKRPTCANSSKILLSPVLSSHWPVLATVFMSVPHGTPSDDKISLTLIRCSSNLSLITNIEATPLAFK